ncbi:hypothetical protein [Actinomadura sp. CNU-125]|uniref:hypothetical protein n=1 Tax=Actinomadura sp. CNU-125 TaxID=1904961 RepID=UPI0011783228|nr:hypothetical protein [Actinomadura sp. CNU-125]
MLNILEGDTMNAESITATCAVVVAVASLVISFAEHRANRKHNQNSIRPLLQINRVKRYRSTEAGLKLKNCGLGPAMIVESIVKLDGEILGGWDVDTFERVENSTSGRIEIMTTLGADRILQFGQEVFILGMYDFDDGDHAWFWELVTRRLSFEIRYESIYGGESFTARLEEWNPRSGRI